VSFRRHAQNQWLSSVSRKTPLPFRKAAAFDERKEPYLHRNQIYSISVALRIYSTDCKVPFGPISFFDQKNQPDRFNFVCGVRKRELSRESRRIGLASSSQLFQTRRPAAIV
jgi:hypothetical protein